MAGKNTTNSVCLQKAKFVALPVPKMYGVGVTDFENGSRNPLQLRGLIYRPLAVLDLL